MKTQSPESRTVTLPRVKLLRQPLGLGFLLAVPGGYLCWNMILALDFSEHWALTVSTFVLIGAFFAMFAQGIWYLLTPFHRIRVSREEVQLRMGPLVLRRIPVDQLRSVTNEMRTVLIRNRERDFYQIKFYRRGAPNRERPVWMDWCLDSEEQLKALLTETDFLF